MKAFELILLLEEERQGRFEGKVLKVKKILKLDTVVLDLKIKDKTEKISVNYHDNTEFKNIEKGDNVVVIKTWFDSGREGITDIELIPRKKFMPKKFKPLNKKIDLE